LVYWRVSAGAQMRVKVHSRQFHLVVSRAQEEQKRVV
jgi:hypothetical protein